jgi:lactam utilization protein B
MTNSAIQDRYNELPELHETEVRDGLVVGLLALLANTHEMDAHIENVKTFGAVWYANATDHPVAAEVLSGVS